MHRNFLILEASWDSLDIKYIRSVNLTKKALSLYVVNAENFKIDWLNYIPQNLLQDYLFVSFAPYLLKQIYSQEILPSHLRFIDQVEITEPSMLYFALLLQAEIKAPQVLSQEFVLAIITAMISSTTRYELDSGE
jgi:hypothetical protein